MTIPAAPTTPTARVLSEVARMINQILGDYALAEAPIEMDTSFHEDLEMESIDLVTLAALLASEYGPEVNLAEFLANKDLEQVIALTVGDIVEYVVSQTERI